MIYLSIYTDIATNNYPDPPSRSADRVMCRYFPSISDRPVYYPSTYPKYPLLPMIQVCRQIRDEFFWLVSHRPSVYKLEILSPGNKHFPTWLRLPLPLSIYDYKLDTLDVTYILQDVRRSSGYFTASDGPGSATYGLFRLFSDFFHHGPQWYFDSQLSRPDTYKPFVSTLIINMEFEYSGLSCSGNVGHTRNELHRGRMFRALCFWIKRIDLVGYFCGNVGRVLVRYGDESEEVVVNQDRDMAGFVDEDWERYGFTWGIERETRKSLICTCRKGKKSYIVDNLPGLAGHLHPTATDIKEIEAAMDELFFT